MSLSAGTRLGPYEILSALGAGGMGKVHRATDTNLKREVAIKVLPQTVATDPRREHEAATRLGRIGFDHIVGHLPHGLHSLETRPDLTATTERVSAPLAAQRLGQREALAVDVRAPGERAQKSIAGSVGIPLNHLVERAQELPKDRPLLVYCAGGYRSAIAVSILQQQGFTQVARSPAVWRGKPRSCRLNRRRPQRRNNAIMRMLAIVAIVLVGQTASAQTQASYVALVEQYAAGDASGAVQLLATGTPRVSGEIVERMRQRPDRDVRSAVMLHTELAAVWLVNGRTPPAIVQIDNAKRLLRILTADATRRGRSKAFAIQWYAFTTSLYVAQGLVEVASRTVRDGLTDFPGASELYVAGGTVHEERASLEGDGNSLTADGNPTSNQSQRLLEAAAAEYQRALAADGDLAAAHLHRGWVLFRLGDRRAAASLDLALAHATDDRVRYLAHLFRGAVAEASKDLERARSEFEAAKGVGPYQTAYIALGRVEESLGHGDRARTLAAEYAQLESTRDDPWWDYRIGGGITGALDWLRREARRP